MAFIFSYGSLRCDLPIDSDSKIAPTPGDEVDTKTFSFGTVDVAKVLADNDSDTAITALQGFVDDIGEFFSGCDIPLDTIKISTTLIDEEAT